MYAIRSYYAHHFDVAGAVEAVIRATDLIERGLREVHDLLHDRALDLRGVDEVRHAEMLGHLALGIVQINADDHVGTGHLEALQHVQADPAQTKDNRLGADLDLGGVDSYNFV